MKSNTQSTRRSFLKLFGVGVTAQAFSGCIISARSMPPPNIIVIFADDMGYGDLGCYGSEKNRTPNIDRMAAEGMKFTDFYVACSVCTPSRAALLTGCYPKRVSMQKDENGKCVLFPNARKGLHPSEMTIAELLKQQGYETACIGKWHLGDQPEFLPTRQGFDYYFGIPYSNDMGVRHSLNKLKAPLPLMRNEKVIEAPVDQDSVTKRYTEEAIEFIRKCKRKPFFLYLPHMMVHLPLAASADFRDKSNNGRFGDATEEVDWSTGEILKTLKELGIDDNTLVIYTSDNGSYLSRGGSNGKLRGKKGQTWEGGMRVPCIMRMPGLVPAGKVCSELSSSIDFLPTFARISGTSVPRDRIIDGKDIWPMMTGLPGAKSPHEAFYYYQIDQLQCVRSGKWKLHLPLEPKLKNWAKPEGNSPLMLFDLEADIHEDNNIADQHPDVVKRLLELAAKMQEDIGDLNRDGKNVREAGWVDNPSPRTMEE